MEIALRRTHLAGELDRADIDAQLQRGRGYQRLQFPRSQAGLGAPPPLRREAAMMGGDLVRAEDLAQQVSQALGQPAGVDEHERCLVALHVLGDPRHDLAHLFLGKDGRHLLFGQFDADPQVAAVAAVHDLHVAR